MDLFWGPVKTGDNGDLNMKKRYSEEQIIRAIKQHEAGAKVDDICREMGISTGTFYNWRSKYAGLEVNEAKRLKELESENNKLKKMLADKLLEVEAMKDVLSKKWRAIGIIAPHFCGLP